MPTTALRFPCGINVHRLSIETNQYYDKDTSGGLWSASVGPEHGEEEQVLEAFGQASHCGRAVEVLNRASCGVADFATHTHELKRDRARALRSMIHSPGGIAVLALCVIWTARDTDGVVFDHEVDRACHFAVESSEAMTSEQAAWATMLTSAPIVKGGDLMRKVPDEWHVLAADLTVWAWDWWNGWGWNSATALTLWQALTQPD